MEITPLLPDGHNGPIKRLSCASCRHCFYVSQEDYQSLHPLYCHECSLKCIRAERGRTKKPVPKETFPQAEQNAQAEEMKIEVMSPEDKMVLYAVLQEMADELRRIDRERRKQ